jgi:uncharacterized membrane protein/nitrite reductase/ring-hydroxylating ferredoxin subunit
MRAGFQAAPELEHPGNAAGLSTNLEVIMRSRASLASHPIHPMLVFFPLGLWITSFAFDVIGSLTQNDVLWAGGFYLIIGGCAGAALAAIPGAIDLFSVVPRNSSGRSRGYVHGTLNSLVLLLFIFVAWRRGDPTVQPDTASLLLSLLGVLVILYSGWLGATLVYRNQIGVDHRYAKAGKWKERTLRGWDQPVCNQGELSEGQMMMAIVGDEHVVVGRCPDGYTAFSNHCTHKGGPLSDGALIGCTVQCPWHGSQFDVHTGRVVAGPAEHKIHTYRVDARGGEVYVSPHREWRQDLDKAA